MSKLFPKTFWEKVCFIWREILAAFCVAVAVSLCSGCMNIQYHVDGMAKPYGSTRSVCCGIAEAFVEKPEWHSGCKAEASMSHAYSILLLPFVIVALPIEAVADTVTLPYDLYKNSKD